MLVARSRIPRVSSTAWGCPLAVPPGAAPEHRRYASTACAQRTSRGGCSHDALLAVGPFGLPLQDALSRCASRCRANPDDSKRARPPMNRNAGVCPPVLEHRNDKCHPCLSVLAEEREVHNTTAYPSEPDERALSNGSGDNGSTGGGDTSTPSSTASAGGRRILLNLLGSTERKSFTKSSMAKLSATEACKCTGT